MEYTMETIFSIAIALFVVWSFIYGFIDVPRTKAELLAEEELLAADLAEELLAEPKIFTHRHTVVLSALEMLGDDMSSQARIYKQSSHAERAKIEEALIVAKIII